MKGQGSNRSQGILGSGERRRRRGDSGMDSLRKSVSGDQRCLSQGFYSCTNIMTKMQVGEERVYSAYTSTLMFITKGSQDWNSSRTGTWRQELMQRPWRDVTSI